MTSSSSGGVCKSRMIGWMPSITRILINKVIPPIRKKGSQQALFDSCIVFAAKLQGDNRPASHTQADKDGSKEDHEGIGRADCGKSLGSQEASDNQGICNVIALLEQIAEHERKGKAEHTSGDCRWSGNERMDESS